MSIQKGLCLPNEHILLLLFLFSLPLVPQFDNVLCQMNYFHIFYLIFFTFVLENVLNLYTVDEPYGLITVDYLIWCVIDIYNKMDDRSCQFGAKSRQGFFCDISQRTQTFTKEDMYRF